MGATKPRQALGGGISGGSPLTAGSFLKLSAVSPPVANTSLRLKELATSVEVLGVGQYSTAIGVGANCQTDYGLALGVNCTTGPGAEMFAIGNSVKLTGNNSAVIGAFGASPIAGSDGVLIGTGSGNVASNVGVGAGISVSGNHNVCVGSNSSSSGNNGVAVGANSQAALNSVSIGGYTTSGGGGSAHNINIGTSANGPGSVNGCILIGNRSGVPTMVAGDMVLGHADDANSTYSNRLYLGGPEHRPGFSTPVPAFNISGRYASGADINVGDLSFTPQRATGNAAGGSITFSATAPGAASGPVQTATTCFRLDPRGNITLCAPAGSYGGGVGVVFLGNVTTAPAGAIVGGGVFYVLAGALRYKGSGGTDSLVAPA